jgi:hypothetical protein
MTASTERPRVSRYASRFYTTYRNVLLTWVANFIILPVYLASVALFCITIAQMPDGDWGWLRWVIIAITTTLLLFPVLTTTLAPRQWQHGFAQRYDVALTAILIVIGNYFYSPPWFIPTLILFAFIGICLGLVRFVWSLHILYRSILLVLISIFLILAADTLVNDLNQLGQGLESVLWVPMLATTLIWLVISMITLIFILAHYRNEFVQSVIQQRPDLDISFNPGFRPIVVIIAIYAMWRAVELLLTHQFDTYSILLDQAKTIAPHLISIEFSLPVEMQKSADLIHHFLESATHLITIIILILARGPESLFREQIAYIRLFFKGIRLDRVTSTSSPFVRLQNPLLRLYDYLPSFFSIQNRVLYVSVAIIVGGIVIPLAIYWLTPDVRIAPIDTRALRWESYLKPADILWIAFTGAGLLLFLYLISWALLSRNRYIVTQFDIVTETRDKAQPELRAISILMTNLLVSELQNISSLLTLRQVENLQLGRDDSNAFFVTSGLDKDFFDQMQQVVNLQVPDGGTFNLGRIVALLLRSLARIQVRGTVQQRTNGSVEMWVEMDYRHRQTAVVDHKLLPENTLDELDEHYIRPVAREMALKLLVELQIAPHLGSDWKTLDYFLRGLEASAKRNWWQAIANYRQAIQAEESHRGTFGVGHYHLGAALVFQGNVEEGEPHILTAEHDGPTMAETQYLLALIRLINRWSNLHEEEADFQEIDRRLERALRLKPDFAEAYQLRATAHYQRARTLDRNFKYRVEEKPYAEDDRLKYVSHYRHARRYFFQALRRYDQKHTQTVRNSRLRAQGSEHVQHLTRQRMTAAHQLADSLRALGHYAEAESYYRDMEAIYLRNARNLADIAKTYCLSANWQTAEEFLWQDALKDDTAMWDADINMHVGWALAGGIEADSFLINLPWQVNKLIANTLRLPNQADNRNELLENRLFILAEAMQYLDFAIHQRPRYLNHWRQSEWYYTFKDAYEQICKQAKKYSDVTTLKPDQLFESLSPATLDPRLFWLWLQLRIERMDYPMDDAQNSSAWFFAALEGCYDEQHPFNKLPTYAEELKRCRKKILERQHEQEKSYQPGKGLSNVFERLSSAQEIYIIWKQITTEFNRLSKEEQLSFVGRWALDLMHETALLCAQLLTAAEAHELLLEVTQTTCNISNAWLKRWTEILRWENWFTVQRAHQMRISSTSEHLEFSPRVNRYQLVALESYLVYARYQCAFDPTTVSRIQASRGLEYKIDTEAVIDTLQPILANIRRSIPIHPLYLYTQALVYYKSGLHGQAIETLERLLDVIAPMDPKRDVGGNIFGRRRRQQQQLSSTPRQTSNQEHLGQVERISGRQQFQFLIGRDRVHILIATIFKEIGKVELSIRHLMEAVRWSPHNDLNVDIFLRLADELSLVERYRDAQAVIEAIRIPRYELNMVDLSEAKRNAPDIMECVINTRRTNYSRSLVHGKKIAHRFRILTPQAYIQSLGQAQDITLGRNQEEFRRFLNSTAHVLVNNLAQSVSPFLTGEEEIDKRVKKLLFWKTPEASNNSGETQTESRKPQNQPEDPLPKTLEALIAKFQSHIYAPEGKGKTEAETAALPLLAVFTTLASDRSARARTRDDINDCALFARFAVSLRWRTELLRKIFTRWKQVPITSLLSSATHGGLETPFAQVMFCHAAAYFAEQGLQSLEQIAEICNSLAFNRAETGLHIEEYAKQDSATALAIMAYLYHISDRDTEHYRRFSGHLAQYCDTYGWLHYRMISRSTKEPSAIDDSKNSMDGETSSISSQNLTETFIELAERFLQLGLRYDPVRSIIHFHLARIYLARVELVWQLDPSALALEIEKDVSPQTGGFRIRSSERKAVHIDRYLNEAFRAWREADKHDEHRRLHPRLVWLYNRISAYRRGWDERQLRAIAGITDPGIKSRGNETEAGSLSGR